MKLSAEQLKEMIQEIAKNQLKEQYILGPSQRILRNRKKSKQRALKNSSIHMTDVIKILKESIYLIEEAEIDEDENRPVDPKLFYELKIILKEITGAM